MSDKPAKEYNMDKLYNLSESGGILSISKRSVRRLLDRKQLAYHKIGGLLKISETAIMDYLKCSKVDVIDVDKPLSNGGNYENK